MGVISLCYQNVTTGRVAQSVTCLATDVTLTADPGVVRSIPAWSHTFVEIDHEIISTVILEGLMSVRNESMFMKYWLTAYSKLVAQEKVWLGELTVLPCPWLLTWNVKQQNKQTKSKLLIYQF